MTDRKHQRKMNLPLQQEVRAQGDFKEVEDGRTAEAVDFSIRI